MGERNRIDIDLSALRHNLGRAREVAPDSKILAVVKANAYGHGISTIAQAMQEQCDGFGVCCMQEGMMLRRLGVKLPVVLMEGVHWQTQLPLLSRYNLDVVLHHQMQLDWLRETTLDKPVQVWIKVDTGMHRLGFSPEHLVDVCQALRTCQNVKPVWRLMSHLSHADEVETPTTARQIHLFRKIANSFSGEKSLANSAGILAWPDSHAQWNRPGIMLYGASPFMNNHSMQYNLLPVMTLSSQIIAIRHCAKGAAVGYGGTWVCPEDMKIGIVAIGYADGYPRHVASGAPVLVNGRRAALIGRVAMDMLTVDLRGHDEAAISDPVILWGKGLPVELIARWSGTIAHELLCRVGKYHL